jgi:hypothetical protein
VACCALIETNKTGIVIKSINKVILLIYGFLILFLIAPIAVSAQEIFLESQLLSDDEFQKILTVVPNIEPECEEIYEDLNSNRWLEQVKVIKLNLNEEKFYKSILKKFREVEGVSNLTNRGWSKYRKVEVQFNNSQCKLIGEYRLTGDMHDHMGRGGAIKHSIKIKLKNGRIHNITKFKLLVPRSRAFKYEILIALIHKKMGFMAPKTAMVNVQIGGEMFQALFQEDISKSLLETNDFHDGFIIEGDEGYYELANPKIVNTKLIKSENVNRIARDMLDLISPVYLKTNRLSLIDYSDPALTIDFLPSNSQNRFIHFHLLNFALKNADGLSRDDHRIIYDLISREFFPIYYDGHHNARHPVDVNFKFTKIQKDFVSNNLKKINIKELSSLLKDRGVSFKDNEIIKLINDAVIFLENVSIASSYKEHKKLLEEFNGDSYLKKAAKKIGRKIEVSWKHNESELKTCLINNDYFECALEKVDGSFFSKDYPFHPQNLNDGLFIHGFDIVAKNKMYFNPLEKNSVNIGFSGAVLEHTSNLEPKIDKVNKSIFIRRLEFNDQTAQIKISGGTLKNWILVIDEDANLGYIKQEGDRASEFGLTGCITFNDINLINMTIQLSESKCEDAVHFVRSTGSLNNLIVVDAKSDAIDADFSQLAFEKIQVTNAGNDCLDVSSGLYRFQEAQLAYCGDKGVSAGEGAKVQISSLVLNEALFGIVSKDSSEIEVNEAAITGVKICLSAYRKKQEYGGGSIKVGNDIKCDGAPSFIQKNSRIY